jgi:hypothetical protein
MKTIQKHYVYYHLLMMILIEDDDSDRVNVQQKVNYDELFEQQKDKNRNNNKKSNNQKQLWGVFFTLDRSHQKFMDNNNKH